MNPYGGLGIATLFGGLTYRVDGFKGNGVDGYVNTNFISGLASYNYTLNDAGRFLVVAESGSGYYDGVSASARNSIIGANTAQQRINSGTSQLAVAFDMSGLGLKSIMRDSSTAVRVQNTSTKLTTTQPSLALETIPQLILRGATSTTYSDGCISIHYMGASISNAQIDNFRTYYNTYLTNIGLTPFA
jgi:hypothetical protein